MRLAIMVLSLAAPLFASSICPDSSLREARIGGESIQGSVELRHKPVRFVAVCIYAGDKLVWQGATDKSGRFQAGHLASGEYRVVIQRWGSTKVTLDPKLNLMGVQHHPGFSLMFTEDDCVAFAVVVN